MGQLRLEFLGYKVEILYLLTDLLSVTDVDEKGVLNIIKAIMKYSMLTVFIFYYIWYYFLPKKLNCKACQKQVRPPRCPFRDYLPN